MVRSFAPRKAQLVFWAVFLSLSFSWPPSFSLPDADSLTPKEFSELAHLIDEGSLLPAQSRIESLLARDPDNWRVALLAGRLYRKMGLSGSAIMQYEKVRVQNPQMVEALVALSQMHLENLSTEMAIMLARKAVSVDPHSKDGRLALVQALLAGQSLRQAQEEAQILASMYPSDADVDHTLSSVAEAFGRYDQATALLLRAVGQRPHKLDWLLELSEIYQLEGKFDACRAALLQILVEDPHSLEALTKLAHLQEFDMHEYMSALSSYRRIKEVIPDSAAAQAGIDRCLAKQSDLAVNFRNAVYRIFGVSFRDLKKEESNELPSSF